ncbi:OmpA family protein, partial [Ideonella sp.]|uniref:OmpA family protein n=1 Tax=Ideonella sp. TaxID=1929293 RepID=UPI003BB6727F
GMDAQRAEVRADRAELRSAIAQSQAADVQAQNTQLQQQLAELQARPTERGMLITLADVLFEFNKADVKPAAQTSLMKLADFLRQAPLRSVLIEGHTDNVGEPAYNVALSNRRAQAVKAALLQLGVADARVSTVGYGEEFPVAANSSDSNRAMNRRVEIYIADTEAPVRPRR